MSINIKRNQLKRVVIVGGGLGGLRLAEDLCNSNLQVVLIDKNNFHHVPPEENEKIESPTRMPSL
jgi:NADH:ubiquinone reductase (H+-translocating)